MGKDANKDYNLSWEILCGTKAKPTNNKTRSLEKYKIEKN